MRSLSIIPLLAAYALGQPTGGCLKWGNFTAVDSINGMAMIGSFSGGGLGFLRINADENGCEFVVPTGTDLPVNQRDPALLGHATADTMTINVANIAVLNTDSTVNNISQTTDTATINDRLRLDYAAANAPLQTNASKDVVTGSYTGTGTTEVLSAGPTISNLTATGVSNLQRLKSEYGYGERYPTAGSEYTYFANTNFRLGSQGWRNAGSIVAQTGTTPATQNSDGLILGAVYGSNTYAQSVIHLRSGPSAATQQIEFMTGSGSGIPTTKLTIENNGAITATGPATLQSTLAVTGASTFTGLVSGVSSLWSGLVGIGTTSPSEKLEVRESSASGDASILIVNEAPAGTQGETAEIKFATANNVAAISKISATRMGSFSSEANRNSDLRFWTSASGATTERMRITHGGNVLVNTNTNLGYELQVNGTAYATRFLSGTGTSIMDTLKLDVLDVGDITGAGLFGDSLTVDSALVLANLSANSPLYLDGNNEVKTGSWSGTGTVIPTTQGATLNNPTLTGTVTTPTAITMGSNTFTRSGAHALTLTTGATTNVTLPASGTLYGTATGSITSAQLAASLTNETGSGAAVFGTSPTIAGATLTGTTTAARITSSDSISSALGVRTPYLDVSGPTPSHGIRVFTRALTTGAVHNSAVRVDNSFSGGLGRDVVSALHLTITENDGSADTTAAVYIGAVDPGIVDGWAVMSPTTAPSYFGGDVTVWGDIDLGDGILYVGSGIEAIKYLGSGSSIEIGANVADGGSIYIGNSSAGNAGRVEIIATGGVNSQNGPYHIGGASGVTGTCSSVTVVGGIVTGCTP